MILTVCRTLNGLDLSANSIHTLSFTDTAVASNDYTANPGQVLTFDGTSRMQTVNVELEDDSIFELDEIFLGNLTLVGDPERVTVDPDTAEATILDDESKVINDIIAHK